MPDVSQVMFTYQEVATALVKAQDIHEGLWGVAIEFGMAASNLSNPADPSILLPAAVLLVQKIGIQRFPTPSNLTVDAAIVNPPAKEKKASK